MSDEEYLKARMQVEADKNCMYHTKTKDSIIAIILIIVVIAVAAILQHNL